MATPKVNVAAALRNMGAVVTPGAAVGSVKETPVETNTQTATDTSAAATAPVSSPLTTEVAAARTLHKYAVQLKYNPRMVVAAEDRLDAIEVYKKRCGIIRTEHSFEVYAVPHEPLTPEV